MGFEAGGVPGTPILTCADCTFIGYAATTGVDGISNATAIGANAVVGESNAIVLGMSGTTVGIGTSTPSHSYALVVQGSLDVTGSITAGTKDFNIDDPVDSDNKYLYHASIESSEMKNMYDGVARFDASGEAVVSLPDWFEALNQDFRYQPTAIGAPGPNLYVAEEIKNHQFKIAGGKPGAKVSWQVTGIRHDAWAKAHPLWVEQEKSLAARGHD